MNARFIVAALAAALLSGNAAVAQTADGNENGKKCQTHVNTDKGEGGVQVYSCNDGEGGIGFGGPIKDVDWQHPAGGHNAFLPKAGRDINDTGIAVGKGVEHLGQEIGKLFR